MRNINDLNKGVELESEQRDETPTVFSSSPSPSTLRARRTRMRRGMLRIPLLQTYWLTVVSMTTFSVFMAFWANLRITSMARGAFLLKALHAMSYAFNTEAEFAIHTRNAWHLNLHLVASLVEVDSVVTGDGNHFLLSGVHDSSSYGEIYCESQKERQHRRDPLGWGKDSHPFESNSLPHSRSRNSVICVGFGGVTNKQRREHGTLELEQIFLILIHNGCRCCFVIFPLEQIWVDVKVAASAVLEE